MRVLQNHPGDAKLQTAYFLVTSSYVFVLAIKPDILLEYHAAKGYQTTTIYKNYVVIPFGKIYSFMLLTVNSV